MAASRWRWMTLLERSRATGGLGQSVSSSQAVKLTRVLDETHTTTVDKRSRSGQLATAIAEAKVGEEGRLGRGRRRWDEGMRHSRVMTGSTSQQITELAQPAQKHEFPDSILFYPTLSSTPSSLLDGTLLVGRRIWRLSTPTLSELHIVFF